ncbi:type II toxin-antitoxin system VapC family toxin [Rhizobium wenxiniae]|uniref:type II toxin-antitoxin system VapC family toxin n=1 Tax=Rhizobium wenxiniae TaxID=1737357 RepID=UPI001C6E8F88|nr:type II toxin-antitoxin system VapC family toxin [Rhizobium wenxiniae]MBW9086734.1 type II toxin-antitoxin system VapC family toxin [Rhizobium wenxiniae]
MIVIDSSAIIAIAAGEPSAHECEKILEAENSVLISTGTVAEVLIVAARRKLVKEVSDILKSSVTQTIDLTPVRAHLAATAYIRWGKSFDKAGLNFGDCFSYATAKEFDCPLLYIGDDFVHTDIRSAISSAPA